MNDRSMDGWIQSVLIIRGFYISKFYISKKYKKVFVTPKLILEVVSQLFMDILKAAKKIESPNIHAPNCS